MRVIAGRARSLPLKTVKNMETRPTTDRIKETLFNIINQNIPECTFLDLFSGSGGIGIEALSRGAKSAFFVDNQKEAVSCIRDNLKFTRLSECGNVMECSVISAISMLESRKQYFDIVFMDPQYMNEFERETLERLAHSVIIDENSLIIIEASLDTDFSYLKDLGYELIREKLYKTNKHVFVQKV